MTRSSLSRPVHGDLVDRWVHGPRFLLHELEDRQFLVYPDVTPGHARPVQVTRSEWIERLRGNFAAAGGYRRRGARGGQHGWQREVFRERVAGLLTDNDAQADALIDAGVCGADDTVFQCQGIGARVLEVEVGGVGATRRQLGHDPRGRGLIHAKP